MEASTNKRIARYRWPLLRNSIALGEVLKLQVHGYCMWPTLKPGDVVVVGALGARGPELGDLLVCVHGQRAVVHRAIALSEDASGERWVRCRGDAAMLADAPVKVSEVCGIASTIERGERSIVPAAVPHRASAVFAHLRPWLRIGNALLKRLAPTRKSF